MGENDGFKKDMMGSNSLKRERRVEMEMELRKKREQQERRVFESIFLAVFWLFQVDLMFS